MSSSIRWGLRVLGLLVFFTLGVSLFMAESWTETDMPTGSDISVPESEEHACSGDKNDPGFVCPNAKGPTDENQVLSEKCGGCPKQLLNGGSCPGKYV